MYHGLSPLLVLGALHSVRAHGLRLCGIDYTGVVDMTPELMNEFNHVSEDYERGCGVRIRTIVCRADTCAVTMVERWIYNTVFRMDGENDTRVPVHSQIWREEYFRPPVWDLDHNNVIGRHTRAAARAGRGSLAQQNRVLLHRYLELACEIAREFPLVEENKIENKGEKMNGEKEEELGKGKGKGKEGRGKETGVYDTKRGKRLEEKKREGKKFSSTVLPVLLVFLVFVLLIIIILLIHELM